MKNLVLISALTLGAMSVKTADAQIGIHVNLHFGTPVVVAPAPLPPPADPVYDDYDDYYYLPDVEAYYSVPEHRYYYNDGYAWVSAAYLPGYYRNFDWRTARRFEIHASRPYMHHDNYRGKFGGFSNRADFYARAFPGRERHDDRFDRRPQGYDNRGGWDRQPQRGGYDRDRQNGYNQGGHGNYGGQPQPDRGNSNQYGQPQGQQGGYNQPGQGSGRGSWGGQSQQQGGQSQGDRGNNHQYGQPGQGQGSYGQPSGNQGQGRGTQGGQDRGNNGSQDKGNYGGQQHFAERIGVVNDRVAGNRPGRL